MAVLNLVVAWNNENGNVSIKADAGLCVSDTIFMLEAAKHVLIHSAKMLPAEPVVQAAPIEGDKQ